VVEDCIRTQKIDVEGSVLIIGGSIEDATILHNAGFRRITLTNIHEVDEADLMQIDGVKLNVISVDAEQMKVADRAYDLVLAHEVLHHCSSPHRALLEMMRVSRRDVIFLEPNDSLLMSAITKLKFSFPYELPAVIHNNYEAGGVRNTCVPNYIYRWNPRELAQTVASFLPAFEFALYIRRYWDFNVDRVELARRTETRIGAVTKIIGPGLFLACLHGLQTIMNHLPWLGSQGNKFFGCITMQDQLKPWVVREGDRIVFNRNYGKH
jgi:SAM-dependent methyltransferase